MIINKTPFLANTFYKVICELYGIQTKQTKIKQKSLSIYTLDWLKEIEAFYSPSN